MSARLWWRSGRWKYGGRGGREWQEMTGGVSNKEQGILNDEGWENVQCSIFNVH
ncbi:MAG TPA: hypothetical protein VNS32_18170 [Flavisolibacter sp.]|nr:hypothetical protein [Flavisolibacter sp.]